MERTSIVSLTFLRPAQQPVWEFDAAVTHARTSATVAGSLCWSRARKAALSRLRENRSASMQFLTPLVRLMLGGAGESRMASTLVLATLMLYLETEMAARITSVGVGSGGK